MKYSRTPKTPRKNPLKNEVVCSGFEYFNGLIGRGLRSFIGKNTQIAFTGMPGVGKTLLYDYLSGRALQPDYVAPSQSQSVERGRIKSGKQPKQKLAISVLPGQRADPRFQGAEKLFGSGKVEGVVHVVANGLATLRSPVARRNLIAAGTTTLSKYQEHQRELELKDLEETCQLIRDSQRAARRPTWIIVAVTKADLYQRTIQRAQEYYSAEADTPFAKCLRDLVSKVGEDNLRYAVAPVSSHLQPFRWNGRLYKPRLTPNDRDIYLAQFLNLMSEYSE